VQDRVDFPDGGQEFVAESLALCGAFAQAGDVDKPAEGGSRFFAV
jgi:hypothetical protein